MFGNEGWRWVGSPQPPTPGKVVALGDRAAGAGPLSAEWGGGARALRLGHPVCVPAPGPQPLSHLPGSPTLPSSGQAAASAPGGGQGPASSWKSHYGVPS